MAIKLLGAEWKKFYLSEEMWPNGWYHEDAEIEVNGILSDNTVDLGTVEDTAIITVGGGDVYDAECNLVESLASKLKKWRKGNNTTYMAVSIDTSKAEELKAAITALGGKILK